MGRRIGVMVAVGLLVAACGGGGGDDEGAGTATTERSTTTAEPSTSGSTSSAVPAESPLEEIEPAVTLVAEVDGPTSLVVRPGSPVLYVAERDGTVRPVTVSGSGADRSYEVGEPVLDISDEVVADEERGLLDIEFSDDGAVVDGGDEVVDDPVELLVAAGRFQAGGFAGVGVRRSRTWRRAIQRGPRRRAPVAATARPDHARPQPALRV